MISIVFDIIEAEHYRQYHNAIELIASENFVSENVMKAVGSCLTNKYSEGYPGRRYYGGCQHVDELESYCQQKWREAFKTQYAVNVQPHSGSSANMAALMAVLDPGDTILSMGLNDGGHLTHGAPVSFSGKLYNVVSYSVDESGIIDYDEVAYLAHCYRPKLIIAGASSYSREIDYSIFYEIAHEVGALLMVDMAHVAGLVVAGDHMTPFGYADIVTTTTHKTLRGTRGGLIFSTHDLAKKIDSAVFPGTQGGALQHVIAGKAVTAEEACTPEFHEYIHQVCKNAKAMAEEFKRLGYEIVSGGTDNHMFVIDFSRTHPELTGKAVQDKLDEYGVTLNKQCVPGEKRSPTQTSGVRIGTPAMTTRGWKEDDFIRCAQSIDMIIRGKRE